MGCGGAFLTIVVRISAAGALLLGALLLWVPAYAQSGPTIVPPSPRGGSTLPIPRRSAPARPGSPVVAEIVVEGTQRIEPETVRSYMLIKEGDPLDPEAGALLQAGRRIVSELMADTARQGRRRRLQQEAASDGDCKKFEEFVSFRKHGSGAPASHVHE